MRAEVELDYGGSIRLLVIIVSVIVINLGLGSNCLP